MHTVSYYIHLFNNLHLLTLHKSFHYDVWAPSFGNFWYNFLLYTEKNNVPRIMFSQMENFPENYLFCNFFYYCTRLCGIQYLKKQWIFFGILFNVPMTDLWNQYNYNFDYLVCIQKVSFCNFIQRCKKNKALHFFFKVEISFVLL